MARSGGGYSSDVSMSSDFYFSDDEESLPISPEARDMCIRETFFSLYAPGFNSEYRNPYGTHIGAYSYLMKAEIADGTKVMLKFPTAQHDVYENCLMTLREVKYLSLMNHENVMRLRRVGGKKSIKFATVFIEMDFMDYTLKYLIETPSEYFHVVADSNTKCMYQLFSGLAYIHSAQLVHRHMKPSDILFDKLTGTFKIADFHMARKIAGDNEHMTKTVGARTHLSPELVFKPSCHSPAMDIYAAGIIFIEVLKLSTPFFHDYEGLDRIEEILGYTGLPDDAELCDLNTEDGKNMVRGLAGGRPKTTWKQVFPEFPNSVTELLEELLQFASSRRITAANALKSPYFASVRPAGWTAPTYVGPPLQDYPPTLPMLTIIRQLNESITVDFSTDEDVYAPVRRL